jgi:hypothetical protein
MHMKRGGACPSCSAFYVTNHFDAEDALARVNPAATVALDDNGPKFVPALCVICHSGSI